MIIDGKEISDLDIVSNEKDFLKRHGNFYITQTQIDILKKYDIDIDNYTDIDRLIYDIEECLNDSFEPLDDLDWVSSMLSEYNYYSNTNK